MGEKDLSIKAREALRHIQSWLVKKGTMPSLRELMDEMNYKSPRSPMLLVNELEENGFLAKNADGTYRVLKHLSTRASTRTLLVPLVGSVTCGTPMLAEENVEAMIPVDRELVKPSNQYFLLRAKGDSMNLAGIDDNDLLLVKQQASASNGQMVVALIDDVATVKEFQHKGSFVTLVPRSTNKSHQPIILTTNFSIQGVIVATIPKGII